MEERPLSTAYLSAYLWVELSHLFLKKKKTEAYLSTFSLEEEREGEAYVAYVKSRIQVLLRDLPESKWPRLNEVESDPDIPVINHGVDIESIVKMIEEKASLYSDDPAKKTRLSASWNVRKEKVQYNWRDYLRLHCYPHEYGEPINMPRGRSPVPDSQRHPKSCDISVSPKREFNLYCGETSSHHQTTKTTTLTSENIFSNRGHPLPTSPIHPRGIGVCPGSPRLRQDDLKSPPHPLPLPPPSSPRSSSSRSIPSQWRKGKLLGRGTFGHVYLGFNRESGQMCAIKEVEVISDDNYSKERFGQLNQEIALLSEFSHPNIVQYYGSELADDTLSVYLEYVSGGSVNKLLNDYGPFGEPVIRRYTRQILSGLAYLHGRNTMHRDIKGANILVDPNGEIKLADFGMAKHTSGLNSVRSLKGTPNWMAPEVIMNASGYNLAVDIWSLGCTILEMATSKHPWSVCDGVQAIFKIANSRELPDIPEHLSSDAKKFLMLCLQRDPAARPTATQLMDHPFVRSSN